MYCKYCGSLIDKDSSFCSHCGKRLNENSTKSPKTNDTNLPLQKCKLKRMYYSFSCWYIAIIYYMVNSISFQ